MWKMWNKVQDEASSMTWQVAPVCPPCWLVTWVFFLVLQYLAVLAVFMFIRLQVWFIPTQSGNCSFCLRRRRPNLKFLGLVAFLIFGVLWFTNVESWNAAATTCLLHSWHAGCVWYKKHMFFSSGEARELLRRTPGKVCHHIPLQLAIGKS